MSRYVFVGGPWDGRAEYVDDELATVVVPEERTPFSTIRPVGSELFAQVETKTFRYQRMDFAGERKRFSLFVNTPLTADDVLGMLIHAYGRKS